VKEDRGGGSDGEQNVYLVVRVLLTTRSASVEMTADSVSVDESAPPSRDVLTRRHSAGR